MPEPIHITGSAIISSLGGDVDATVTGMIEGKSGIATPANATDSMGTGSMAPAACIDPAGMARTSAMTLATDAARTAMRDVDCDASRIASESVGLILSTTKVDIDPLVGAVETHTAAAHELFSIRHFVDALAKELSITGPRVGVSNACASGLAAMMLGARWLIGGVCDRVVVVGVDVLSRFTTSGFMCLGALSPQGCRPFDANRDGLTLGEAAAVVVLERGGRPKRGVMTGWAMTNDAFHLTAPVRGGRPLIDALHAALTMSGLSANAIDMINAHGTGTIYNDEMESVAYAEVFGSTTPVLSMKGYIGHTLGAAGIVEAVICLEWMKRGVVAGNRLLDKPGVSGRICLPRGPIQMPMRHVMTVKTGFGGINAAVVLSAP